MEKIGCLCLKNSFHIGFTMKCYKYYVNNFFINLPFVKDTKKPNMGFLDGKMLLGNYFA